MVITFDNTLNTFIMEAERIFSAEQIRVHPDLSKIIREYTKAIIRNNPGDLIEFSWRYFKELADSEEEKALAEERTEYERELSQNAPSTDRRESH